jgi:hypothetical protein
MAKPPQPESPAIYPAEIGAGHEDRAVAGAGLLLAVDPEASR